jgi:dTDP-4-amino-4,6-dideoxy-D-galactose acyltransferase
VNLKSTPKTGLLLEPLTWDTQFFGVRIARLNSAEPTDEQLGAAVTAARREHLQCIYARMAPMGGPRSHPEQFGFRLMDVQLDLSRPTDLHDPRHPTLGIRVRPGTLEDLDRIGPILNELAPWSRFAVDPRFGVESAHRMYKEWTRKSAITPGALFAVAIRNRRAEGFVTGELSPGPRIGLIGVSRRGHGVGRALMTSVLKWAAGHGRIIHVTTQARNVAALRFYERHGFLADAVNYVYHCWLDEPGKP